MLHPVRTLYFFKHQVVLPLVIDFLSISYVCFLISFWGNLSWIFCYIELWEVDSLRSFIRIDGWAIGRISARFICCGICYRRSLIRINGWAIGRISARFICWGICYRRSLILIDGWAIGRISARYVCCGISYRRSLIRIDGWAIGRISARYVCCWISYRRCLIRIYDWTIIRYLIAFCIICWVSFIFIKRILFLRLICLQTLIRRINCICLIWFSFIYSGRITICLIWWNCAIYWQRLIWWRRIRPKIKNILEKVKKRLLILSFI